MNKHIEKDKKRRGLIKKYMFNRLALKSMAMNGWLPLAVRRHASLMLDALPKDSSQTRLVNRCAITGRSRSVSGNFRLSRLMLKEWARSGVLPGVIKK